MDDPMMFAEAIRIGVGFVTWRHTTFIGETVIDRAYDIEPRAEYDARQARILGAMRDYTVDENGYLKPTDSEGDDEITE
jgi:hypothetical protein